MNRLFNYTSDQIDALITKIKAIIYVRVSTSDQAERGYSLESQIERCKYLAYEKFKYSDDELLVMVEAGESGDDPDRPKLNETLYLVENGVSKKVIMLHPDRMSRYLALQTEVSQRIWSSGCDIEFVEFEVDPNNPESMLMFNIQGSIAQYNKAKILANSRRGRKQKAKNGQINGMRRLYGYTFDKEHDVLLINPEESKVYNMMVGWVLYGKKGVEMNLTNIAEELSKLNIPAPLSNSWRQGTVSKILRNEAYKGYYFYGKTEIVQIKGKKKQVKKPREEWIGIPIPPLIDDITFEKLQHKLNSRIRTSSGAKPKITYLIKGLARCGRCSGAVVASAPSRSRSGEIINYFYTCRNKSKYKFEVGTGESNTVCRGHNWRKDEIDKLVWNHVIHMFKNPERICEEIIKNQDDTKQIDELNNQKIQIENSIKDKRKTRNRYIELYADGIITSKDELTEKIAKVDATVAELESELFLIHTKLNQHNANLSMLEKIKLFAEGFRSEINFDTITDEEKVEWINKVIHKVVLNDESIDIYTRWRPNDTADVSNNSIHGQGDGGLP